MMHDAYETRRKLEEATFQYHQITSSLWQTAQEGLARSRAHEQELQIQMRQVTVCLNTSLLRPSTVRVLQKELQLLGSLLEESSTEVQAWEELMLGIDRGCGAANEDQWAVQF